MTLIFFGTKDQLPNPRPIKVIWRYSEDRLILVLQLPFRGYIRQVRNPAITNVTWANPEDWPSDWFFSEISISRKWQSDATSCNYLLDINWFRKSIDWFYLDTIFNVRSTLTKYRWWICPAILRTKQTCYDDSIVWFFLSENLNSSPATVKLISICAIAGRARCLLSGQISRTPLSLQLPSPKTYVYHVSAEILHHWIICPQSSHAAYYVATQMALAHNGILRGLNSIYLQATHIPREDLGTVKDFLTYCQCWGESMHHHHDAEEAVFFPSIEQISGVQGIMQRNIEQHRAFTPGFDRFQQYSRTCLPKDYDGRRIRNLIEDFAESLTQHLHDEIETLRGLDKYDSERIRQAYKRLEKSLMATDNVR